MHHDFDRYDVLVNLHVETFFQEEQKQEQHQEEE